MGGNDTGDDAIKVSVKTWLKTVLPKFDLETITVSMMLKSVLEQFPTAEQLDRKQLKSVIKQTTLEYLQPNESSEDEEVAKPSPSKRRRKLKKASASSSESDENDSESETRNTKVQKRKKGKISRKVESDNSDSDSGIELGSSSDSSSAAASSESDSEEEYAPVARKKRKQKGKTRVAAASTRKRKPKRVQKKQPKLSAGEELILRLLSEDYCEKAIQVLGLNPTKLLEEGDMYDQDDNEFRVLDSLEQAENSLASLWITICKYAFSTQCHQPLKLKIHTARTASQSNENSQASTSLLSSVFQRHASFVDFKDASPSLTTPGHVRSMATIFQSAVQMYTMLKSLRVSKASRDNFAAQLHYKSIGCNVSKCRQVALQQLTNSVDKSVCCKSFNFSAGKCFELDRLNDKLEWVPFSQLGTSRMLWLSVDHASIIHLLRHGVTGPSQESPLSQFAPFECFETVDGAILSSASRIAGGLDCVDSLFVVLVEVACGNVGCVKQHDVRSTKFHSFGAVGNGNTDSTYAETVSSIGSLEQWPIDNSSKATIRVPSNDYVELEPDDPKLSSRILLIDNGQIKLRYLMELVRSTD